MIHEIKGNLLDTTCTYICHQVNCQGKMNSGVAKSIREKWPIVYKQYHDWYIGCEAWVHTHGHQPADVMLGHIQVVDIGDKQKVINMAAQNSFGYDGRRYTSYDAFWLCLGRIKETIPKSSLIAFPKKISCCRGGANWTVIKAMIDAALGEDYNVYMYELEEEVNE